MQGYHGLSKDDDRLWAMEIDREHSRGGGVLHHSHNPAHPLGWTGLVETLPPPPGALPLAPPPPPHNSAGDPNGHPPPGNSGSPVSTGQVSPGQVTAGSLLADSPLADWFKPVPVVLTTIIYQLGTAVPGAELQPARPLVPTPTTTTTPTPPPGPRPPSPPPPPPAWSGRARGGPGVWAGSGGRQTHLRSGLSPTPPGTPQCRVVAAISMVTITLLVCQAGRWPMVMTRGQAVESGDLSSSPHHHHHHHLLHLPASGITQLELLSQVSQASVNMSCVRCHLVVQPTFYCWLLGLS